MLPRHLLLSILCFLHGTMTASEGMLKAAIRKSGGGLRDYFREHLREEVGHVTMLERDLARLGVREILKFPAAAQIAGAQYYYIEHEHPSMLLGYMAALECNSLSLDKLAALEREYGPLTCARHHATHDPQHGAELRRQLDELLEPFRRRALENEQWTMMDYRSRCIPMIELASPHFLTRH
jgi:hypothetical protein